MYFNKYNAMYMIEQGTVLSAAPCSNCIITYGFVIKKF